MSDLTPPAPVNIEIVPLNEVSTNSELHNSLIRILDDDMPGLIIRASGLGDIEAISHEEITQAVIDNLNLIDTEGQYEFKGFKRRDGSVTSLTIDGPDTASRVGNFHFDAARNNGHFNVHTTDEGTGRVLLADSADSFDMAHYTNNRASDFYRKTPHTDLLKGYVDPRLVKARIHTANINEGDSVVFPFTKIRRGSAGVKPVWHRFDTRTKRISRVAEIRREELGR